MFRSRNAKKCGNRMFLKFLRLGFKLAARVIFLIVILEVIESLWFAHKSIEYIEKNTSYNFINIDGPQTTALSKTNPNAKRTTSTIIVIDRSRSNSNNNWQKPPSPFQALSASLSSLTSSAYNYWKPSSASSSASTTTDGASGETKPSIGASLYKKDALSSLASSPSFRLSSTSISKLEQPKGTGPLSSSSVSIKPLKSPLTFPPLLPASTLSPNSAITTTTTTANDGNEYSPSQALEYQFDEEQQQEQQKLIAQEKKFETKATNVPLVPKNNSNNNVLKSAAQAEKLAAVATTGASQSDIDFAMEKLSNFVNVWDNDNGITNPNKSRAIPVLFRIPKAGSQAVQDIINKCHLKTIAIETRGNSISMSGGSSSIQLDVSSPQVKDITTQNIKNMQHSISKEDIMDLDGNDEQYVTAIDTIITSMPYEMNSVLSSFSPNSPSTNKNNNYKGRLFAVFRHPIDRALSLFNYKQTAYWEPTFFSLIQNVTIEQASNLGLISNNWLTRVLSNAPPRKKMTEMDLDIAKRVLKEKFIVGLTSKLEESMQRFETIFNWKFSTHPDYQEQCHKQRVYGHNVLHINHKRYSFVEEGSIIWNSLFKHNYWDLQLYNYIENELFIDQGKLIKDGISSSYYRHINSTCCLCDPPTYPIENNDDDDKFVCPISEEDKIYQQQVLLSLQSASSLEYIDNDNDNNDDDAVKSLIVAAKQKQQILLPPPPPPPPPPPLSALSIVDDRVAEKEQQLLALASSSTTKPAAAVAAAAAAAEMPTANTTSPQERIQEQVLSPVLLPSASSLLSAGGGVESPMSSLSNYASILEPYDSKNHIPVIFHIPKTGGTTVKDLLLTCYLKSIATERLMINNSTAASGHGYLFDNTVIYMVYPKLFRLEQKQHVNSSSLRANIETSDMILRQNAIGIMDNNNNSSIGDYAHSIRIPDIVVTKFIHETNYLFTSNKRGKLFSIFRHPFDRTISMYNYIQIADWEPTYTPEILTKNISFVEYLKSDKSENNWMIRHITGIYQGALNDTHLHVAKRILREKFLVGLLTNLNESIDRYEKYFQLKFMLNPVEQEQCRYKLINGGKNTGGAAKNSSYTDMKSKVNRISSKNNSTEIWEAFLKKNLYDWKLYEYVEELFIEQSKLFVNIPDDYRNVDSTCCLCHNKNNDILCKQEENIQELLNPTRLSSLPLPSPLSSSSSSVPPQQKSIQPVNRKYTMPPINDNDPFTIDDALGKLSNFANVWDDYSKNTGSTIDDDYIPVFFHIPKAGGSSIQETINICHLSTVAIETRKQGGGFLDTDMNVVIPLVRNITNQRMRLIQHRVPKERNIDLYASTVDTIITKLPYELNDFLSSNNKKGRLFTAFRHPIDRALSLFNYIQIADWEPTYKPELQNLTIQKASELGLISNNWITRTLSKEPSKRLTQDHLTIAKTVLKEKFIIGLTSKMNETMERLEKIFKWKYKVYPMHQETCRHNRVFGGANLNKKKKYNNTYQEGSPVWNAIAKHNHWDLQLYSYVEKLYDEQEALVSKIADNYRNFDTTCCLCDPPTYPKEQNFLCPNEEKKIPSPSASSTSSMGGTGNRLAASKTTAVPHGSANQLSASKAKVAALSEKAELSSISDAWASSPLPTPLYANTSFTITDALSKLSNFADVNEIYNPNDIPALFLIPKTGSTTVKKVMINCYFYATSIETHVGGGKWQDTRIALYRPKIVATPDSSFKVRVDPGDVIPSKEAKGMFELGMADFFITKIPYEVNDLFTPNAKGQLFAVFRHPIDRALSSFNDLKVDDSSLKDMTIEEYAKSEFVANNWLTRRLSQELSTRLNDDHLEVAKTVLRRKFIVGLTSNMDETIIRFEKFFRWKYKVNPDFQEQCRQNRVESAKNHNENNEVEKNSQVWKALAHHNVWDLKLYDFIENLFEEQAILVANIPDDFRNTGTSCCACTPPTFPAENPKFSCPEIVPPLNVDGATR